MSSPRVSTAGMSLQYAAETTAGTRPTTGYTPIIEIKTTPATGSAPNTIDSTTLMETEFMTYVRALQDPGAAMEFTANLTDDLIDQWDDVITAYNAAVAENKQVWFAIVHPKIKKAFYFAGEPTPLGMNEASVNGMLETTLYIVRGETPGLQDKPTEASGISYSAAKKSQSIEV